MKKILIIGLFFFFCINSYGQQFKTHAVKAGETLESIARTYGVTSEEIIKLNPEAKNGAKANTVLIIPNVTKPKAQETVQEVTFRTHKVRKKETLFGLAKQYNVSEEDIKRYNKELYSRQIKKGEKLRIPVFQVSTAIENETKQENRLKKYTVKPKEGKWRIAYEHGITVEELEKLNPNMGEVLNPGDEIMVPNGDKQVTETVDDTNYNYYTVLPKEGFYRLKVKFGVSQQQVEELNPLVKEKGLLSGMVIKLPKSIQGNFTVKEGKITMPYSLVDSLNTSKPVNLAFVMPYKLSEMRFDSIADVKRKLKKDRLVNVSLDFYTGALMALDSVKQLGLSVNLKIFDSEDNESTVARLVSTQDFSSYEAVIGPILAKPFNRLAKELSDENIPVFAPFTNKDVQTGNNVFVTLPSDEACAEAMIEFLIKNSSDKNLLLIADKNSTLSKNKIIAALPAIKVVPLNNNSVNIGSVKALLSSTKTNWVVVESNNIPFLTTLTDGLNGLNSKETKIVMLTTKKGDAYETSDDIRNNNLSNLNFHYPTVNKSSDYNKWFYKNFEAKFGYAPNRYAVRGFDLTMDILLRLGNKADMFAIATNIPETQYIENKFDYERTTSGGYVNKGVFVVKIENMEVKDAN